MRLAGVLEQPNKLTPEARDNLKQTWHEQYAGVDNAGKTAVLVKTKMVVFEIDPAPLDIEGGFDCIRLTTGASNAANITSATILMVPLRFGQATTPSSRVD